jgi:hypothetical protein
MPRSTRSSRSSTSRVMLALLCYRHSQAGPRFGLDSSLVRSESPKAEESSSPLSLRFAGANPTSSPLLFSALCRQLTAPPSTSAPSPSPEEPMDVDDRTPPPEMPAPKPPSQTTSARHACIVSRLTSRECGNIKNAMRSLIAGFIGNAPEMLDDDDDDEDGPAVSAAAPKNDWRMGDIDTVLLHADRDV